MVMVNSLQSSPDVKVRCNNPSPKGEPATTLEINPEKGTGDNSLSTTRAPRMSHNAHQPNLPSFRPLPFLSSPHLQTFIGAYLQGKVCGDAHIVHRVPVSDGDFVLVHDNLPPKWSLGRPMALLVHGLGGTHQSNHVRRLAARLLARNIRTFRLNLRAAGEGIRHARKTYHAGRSDDLRAALMHMHKLEPNSPLFLMGVSLGGNLSLKLAGEAAVDPVPGLEKIAVIAPPIDLTACCERFGLPDNKIYEQSFLKILVRFAQERARQWPDEPRILLPQSLNMTDFDNLFTAPINGFADAFDYYRKASAHPVVPEIRVPTLIITARDDPFIVVEPFENLPRGGKLDVRILDHGGHVGFIGWDGAWGVRWAEKQMVDWIAAGCE
jgi:hypothetical protein